VNKLKSLPKIYTISSGLPFIEELAGGLLSGELFSFDKKDPLALSRIIILLPTRRACKTFKETFVNRFKNKATVLPLIIPLGDVGDKGKTADISALTEIEGLPPKFSNVHRQLFLARLVLAKGEKTSVFENKSEENICSRNLERALRLSRELSSFLDEAQTEKIDLGNLEKLVPEEHSTHWQQVLLFLKILVEYWPNILSENNSLDWASRRNIALENLARNWAQNPPPSPVIVAGSTGSIPATAELLSVVSRLPQGGVVLPGLDQGMDDKTWGNLDETHPQYGLKQLLNRVGISKDEVLSWPRYSSCSLPMSRLKLITQAMSPVSTMHNWSTLPKANRETLQGLSLCECANSQIEAGVIALRLRASLEEGNNTAILVTTDRSLARRVTVELKRWGVEIDDSGGIPLGETPIGAFLRLSIRLVMQQVAPIPFLSALKHPLASGGRSQKEFREIVRQVELSVLRGARPEPGFLGLRQALKASSQPSLSEWVSELERAASSLRKLENIRCGLAELVNCHLDFSEWLAGTDIETGNERLWSGEYGKVASRYLNELGEHSHVSLKLTGKEYSVLLDEFLEKYLVHPPSIGHPRLLILSPLEARLQHADLLILGGINEGSWPAKLEIDPWMSQVMRVELGLSSNETRIGLSAHDFSQCCSKPEVMITRAKKVGGEVTIPSRWITRLKTILSNSGLMQVLNQKSEKWIIWQNLLDRSPSLPVQSLPPAPNPPIKSRPRKLSVTQIEVWQHDPYAIYARHILGLVPMDKIDMEPGALDKGAVIHNILDTFLKEYPGELPSNSFTRLIEIGRKAFKPFEKRPGLMVFWWPRFERIANWFIEYELSWRQLASPVASEVTGAIPLKGPAGNFLLYAKADRIDQFQDGKLAIIDYKTGGIPGRLEVLAGLRPQLSLEALIIEKGGFKQIGAGKVSQLAYWQLGGGDPAGMVKVINSGTDIGDIISKAEQGLVDLITAFDDPDTVYHPLPRQHLPPMRNDYEHLERVQEWFFRITEPL